MNKFFILLLSILFVSNFQSQQLKPEIYKTPIQLNNISGDWGTDVAVSSFEPFGKFSGVQRSNGTIYVAVPDTNLVAGRCLVILSSTNLGSSWSIASSVSPATIIPKAKMVAKGDSVYCLFLFGSTVYCWNVVTNNFNSFTAYTNIRDFDVTISSTLSLYLIIDLNSNNDVRVYGSVNGGVTWPNSVYLSSSAAFGKIYMSGSGDTSLINYYTTIVSDTFSCAIRSVRYRESALGTLTIVGSFTSPVASGTQKTQYQSVINNGKAWIFYTTGLTGSIDLNFVQSNDNGTTFGSSATIGSLPGRDEYWFEAKHFLLGTGGVEIAFYSDSLQSGPATNASDKIMYSYANFSTPSTFSSPVSISEHPPGWSARGYFPTMVELYPTSDVGVIWVGLDGANKKVYWDRYSAVVSVNPKGEFVPQIYSLGQNYPNPFNPSTKIEFTLPKDEFVTIKVYDLLGKEVSVLVSKDMKKGIYEIDFNGIRLSSGLYFYKMTAGSFTDVKKMILIK